MSQNAQQSVSESVQSAPALLELLQVVTQLRHPKEGCPWDLKQTHHSLRRYMLEEAYEAVEAMSLLPQSLGLSASSMENAQETHKVDNSTPEALLKDELGDVLLQVVLHSQLASERGAFDFEAVCQNLTEKLVRRHPHVFAKDDSAIDNADAVVQQWAEIKQAENVNAGQVETSASILSKVSKGQPALSRALETSQKAVKVGFAWPDLDSLWACVMSEYDEFRAELPPGAFHADDVDVSTHARLESEFGDILFATVNLARQFKIEPEIALTNATGKFTQRFQVMEAIIAERAKESEQKPEELMATLDFEAWDALWKTAKSQVQLT